MIWLLTFGLCLAVIAYVAMPFYIKKPAPEVDSSHQDVELVAYRDELKNIEHKLRDGDGDVATLTTQKTILEKRLIHSATQVPHITEGKKNGWFVVTFMAVIAGTFGIYALIGSPQLTQPGAVSPPNLSTPRAYDAQQTNPAASQPGPGRDEIEAAMTLSPSDRAAMIQGMVDGLSDKLAQNPNDPNGWVKLLRARKFLGQTEAAQKEIESLKIHFASDPKVVSDILKSSGWIN